MVGAHQPQPVVQDGAAGVAAQVEVAVLGNVDWMGGAGWGTAYLTYRSRRQRKGMFCNIRNCKTKRVGVIITHSSYANV